MSYELAFGLMAGLALVAIFLLVYGYSGRDEE